MDKEIKNLQDAQQLKNELEEFKRQQQELAKKLQEQGMLHEPIETQPQIPEQLSPSTFALNGINLPDDPTQTDQMNQTERIQIEKEALKQAEERSQVSKPQETFMIPESNLKPKSKAELALLTLEEEILVESTEIFLPALKENVVVKPLKSIEELNLKIQNLSFETFIRQINIILLEKAHIKNIPLKEYFNGIEDFENKILPMDRLLMVFGLVKNSFNKLAEFSMVCENCQREFLASPSVENLEFRFRISKEELLNTDFYNLAITKKYLNGKLEIDFGFNPEAIRLKLTRMKSNNEIKENLKEENNILDALDNFTLFVKNIRVYKEDKRKKDGRRLVAEIKFNEDGFDEIFKFIHELPVKVKDIILNETDLTDLEKFSPEFKIMESCPFCGHIHELDNSPEIEFFRKALSLLG